MIKAAFFDTKPYDKKWFDALSESYGVKIKYFDSKLNGDTAVMAKDYDCVIAFVNDVIDTEAIDNLCNVGVKLIALRCAGFNNVDVAYAKDKICVVRVPQYSPYAVAEHAIGLLLCLNRKIHRAYIRTKDFNFSLNNLNGFDLYGKTVGVIGTGKIGRVFIDICKGFGMKILAYDIFQNAQGVTYTDIDTICRESDIISLHCPLTSDTKYLIRKETIDKMKKGVFILNTSRGALINSEDLVDGLKSKKIGGAALDVYEEESDIFFEDKSHKIVDDDTLRILLSMPNVLITSHQAFFTNEALENIADVTLSNIREFFENKNIVNQVK